MYRYSEGTKKGANEVCSFLMDYLKDCVPEKAKPFHLSYIYWFLFEVSLIRTIQEYYPNRPFGIFKRSIKKTDRIILRCNMLS